jgi:hypothetical protein
MFIQGVIRRSPSQTGIPLARPSSDKLHEAESVPPRPPGSAIALEDHHNNGHCLLSCFVSRRLCVSLVRRCTNSRSKLTLCEFTTSLVIAVIAVRALYAGTLATIWTTAPSLPQRPSAQLAAVCLFLATLTIAARCYASSNATHPLVQFSPTPSSFSPIDNSNAQVPHSSNLVLSRLLTSPHQPVQSDTSVILINSKKLLHNQNSNSTTTRRKRFRTKRELKPSSYNRIFDQADAKRTSSFGSSTKLNLEKRSGSDVVVSVGDSDTNDSVGDSDRVNSSLLTVPLEAEHQNDSSFFDEDAPSAHSEGTERPMPPVHDHGNASSVSDLGILVLVLSAIVLTVALGLITCVLSHYRPVAGEGAADGGTAADPHDAARTPTTAPVSTLQPLSTTLRLHPANISTATRTPRGRSTYRKK